MMVRTLAAVALAAGLVALVGCTGQSGPGNGGQPEVVQGTEVLSTAVVTATRVARLPATATPTPPPDPLAPVPVEGLPGVVVPYAAELVELAEATEDLDAQADFIVADVDVDDLADWFSTEWPKLGWGEPEERDGALIFLHETAISARGGEEELERTATVLFDTIDAPEGGASFTLVVEPEAGTDVEPTSTTAAFGRATPAQAATPAPTSAGGGR